jgi:hypothetical protein
MSGLHKEWAMARCGRHTDAWPQIIHRLWRAAQVERQRLVFDRSNGYRFVVSAGPIATRANAVEFVDTETRHYACACGRSKTIDVVLRR